MAAGERILVAMSGGVDSSVAAAMLVRRGYDVMGVTLRLNPCEDQALGRSCCGVDAVLSARSVADQLGIEHAVLDVRREFQQRVLRPAWDDYAQGRTPSPCVLCNQEIKFGLLLERARKLGANRIASGHYARIARGPNGPELLRARDPAKDQSYFLFALSPEQLDSLMLPLGDMTKPEVRALAKELGLAPAERADSQDACLSTSEDGFAESLRQRFEAPARPGNFVDETGKVLGPHEGLHRYTVGQRRGLKIALGSRAFVSELRSEDGAVVLTHDQKALWSKGLVARLTRPLAPAPETVSVQIRSRHTAVPAKVDASDSSRVTLRFAEPQRAVTPGQAAVVYDGERVLGGGWIERALRD